jgi:hypothetical protein
MSFDRYSIHMVTTTFNNKKTTLYHKFKLITNKIRNKYPKNLKGNAKNCWFMGVVAVTCTI